MIGCITWSLYFVKDDESTALEGISYPRSNNNINHITFSMPSMVSLQPSYFATILIYLNDDMKGEEMAFLQWENAESGNLIKAKPESGKAILVYNMLSNVTRVKLEDSTSGRSLLQKDGSNKHDRPLW